MHDIITNGIGFVLVLGFLIFAHESGHFVAAKLFGVRVLVYSFGFGKRLGGFRYGGTDYRLSLIPLGGYVRMAGDIPEDRVTMTGGEEGSDSAPTGAPDEFLSKPKWQRFIILFAGPFMNLVIAVAFLAGLAMQGIPSTQIEPIVDEVTPGKPAAIAGLTHGDRIVRINGDPIDDFEDLRFAIGANAGTKVRIEYIRNGQQRVTSLVPERVDGEFGPIGRAGLSPLILPVIGTTAPGSPARKAGLTFGDRIVAANGTPIDKLETFYRILEKANGAALALDVARGNSQFRTTLAAVKAFDKEDPARGIYSPVKVTKYPLGSAIKYSIDQNRKMLKYTVLTIGRLFRAEGSVKELSGPLSIARISGEMLRRGFREVIALMAMISLQLGFMNLLPIPVLDGGHIMVLIVEGIARRDLSLRVKERVQQVGFAALAALMIVVLYNDVIQNVLRFRKG
jgi:regulator of sigma E protease